MTSQPRITGRAIIVHQGRILLIERWRGSQHYFSIPGGGIEGGETPKQAAKREVEEEMGVDIKLQRPIYDVTIDGSQHHIFLADFLSGQPELNRNSPEAAVQSDQNSHLPRWIDISEVEDLPFGYWQPLKNQLMHDLAEGFGEKVVTITA